MKLVGLTPVLRPLFPYEFEMPAGPSMYPGSGGNSRTGSPIGLAIWYTTMLRIYVHHGTPFCVLTVKRHCLSLTRLPRVAGGAPAVNHKATAIWLALRILAGNEHCNVCDGNMVSEYIFNFFMATYEWMHPKYVCRICNYLFCIHAKFYKHISPSYYKPDGQSLKFYWRCSYWISSQFSIQRFHNL